MKDKTEFSHCFRNPMVHRLPAFALGLCLSFSALADTTTLTLSGATTSSRNVPVTLNFPVTRSGDTGYDAVLSYHTVNGSAFAGIDYTAAATSIVIPAGSTSASIPVTIAAHLGGGPDQTFQLLLDGGTGIGPAPGFTTQQTFATGTSPNFVTAADVNGDGKPDLIVANFGSDTVSVLLNTTAPGATTPSFATQQTFATGSTPISVTVADVNGDGKPDLIVANYFDNTVSVLLNTTAPGATTPSFATQQTFATGTNPYSVTAADVNGDGKPDLIVANLNGNTVSVLLNTTAPGATTPSFATQQTFAPGSNPASVTVADVNGDGKPDLIVANYFDNTVSVLLNTTAPGATTPSFATQQTFATGTNPYSVTAADVNGDGKPDLIVANFNANTVSVLLNTTAPGATTPSFATQQTFPTGMKPFSVTIADVNGDGKPDLIVSNIGDNRVSVLLNIMAPGATTPSFATHQTFGTGTSPYSVTVADINGDGRPDLIVANENDNTVSVLRNTTALGATTPSFAAQQTFATGSGPASVTVADVNGDGKLDVIVANAIGNTVSVLLNTTAPTGATLKFATQQPFATGSGAHNVTAADVNGDGRPDLIVANAGGNNVSVLLDTTTPGAAIPTFTAQQTFATGLSPYSVKAADLNGDGKPDLVVANNGDATVSVLLNTTVPGAATPAFAGQVTFPTGLHPQSVAVADINGDGKPDLIVANTFPVSTVSVLLNTTVPGALTPTFADQVTFVTGAGPYAVTTADINGDGKPDLIVAAYDSIAVSVLLNTTTPGAATPTFTAHQEFPTVVTAHPFAITTADINGDGLPDVIVTNYSGTGNPDSVSVLLNTTTPGAATASFAAQQPFTTGPFPFSVTVADVDGDGRIDVIVGNYFNSTVSVLLNSTAAGAVTPSLATAKTYNCTYPYSVTTADLNGDGRPDLVVANAFASTASVLLNKQYQGITAGSPVTGTITHDVIFANGFE